MADPAMMTEPLSLRDPHDDYSLYRDGEGAVKADFREEFIVSRGHWQGELVRVSLSCHGCEMGLMREQVIRVRDYLAELIEESEESQDDD